MKTYTCKQGSPEWWDVRRGVPTASNFDRIVTPKTGKLSAQADGYIIELLADRIMGVPEGVESYTSREMQYGIDTEPEARAWYALETGGKVDQVGFCTTDDGRFGCSPDGLVGTAGGLELKCPLAKTHIGYVLDGELPPEYRCQVHGSLIVTGRAWWDFVSYCPGIKPLMIRVVPDDFTAILAEALEVFWLRYQGKWAKLREIDPDLQPKEQADAQAEEDAALALFGGSGSSDANMMNES